MRYKFSIIIHIVFFIIFISKEASSQTLVDLQFSSLVSPNNQADSCFSKKQEIKVSIKNVGVNAVDFNQYPLMINTRIGKESYGTVAFSKKINTDSLKSGNSMCIVMGTYNMSAASKYSIKSFIYHSIDTNKNNDTLFEYFNTSFQNKIVISGPFQTCDKGYIYLQVPYFKNIQWQHNKNGSFSDISGGNGFQLRYYMDTTTAFRVMVCNKVYSDTSIVVKLPSMKKPKAKNATLELLCDESGTIHLSANSALKEVVYRWYDSPLSSNPLAEGKTYTYPIYASSVPYERVDTFYVSCKSTTTACESDMIMVTASIKNIFKNPTVKVYPNPNRGNFTIEGKDIEEALKMQAYNSRGQMVYQLDNFLTGNFSIPIDFSDFPKGIYFLQLKGVDSVETLKVVVQ